MKKLWLAMVLLLLSPTSGWATQSCGGQPGWASAEFSNIVHHPDHGRYEVGAQVFSLSPTQFGWQITMLDRDGLEIPIFATPLRPVETNPVNIAGWHFRNANNTGPNMGDVNAPQLERRFTFGTMARDLLANSGVVVASASAEGFGGLGVLTITDYTLTLPEAGQRAAFLSISFSVCLVWQGDGERLDPIVDADPGVAFDTVISTLRGCGLDFSVFKASDRMSKGREGGQRLFLDADMDGDNIPDLVMPITRRHDAAPGFAICLSGTETLVLAGFDGKIGRHLDPAYFNSVDWWGIHTGPIYQSTEEDLPPALSSDAIVMGKDDSSSVILFLTPDLALSSYWQGD